MKIDLSQAKIDPLHIYGGANGSKIGILHQNTTYMMKLPPKPSRNSEMSYTNSCISEYIACHIFSHLGIRTQETLLGEYNGRIVVLCKDFEEDGFRLKEFAYLKNSIIDSEQNGYGTELEDILHTISEQQLVPQSELIRFFWEMFIIDTLLGNFDRHNGNWGFLVNDNTKEVSIAPIFDCGSCLYPQIDEKLMEIILNDEEEIDKRVYVFPTSAIKKDNKKINYYQFLMQTDNIECIRALEMISNRIELKSINQIINSTPYITDTHKQFLSTMIKERKERIIDRAMQRHY